MQIDLIAVGKRMPAWIKMATDEYMKRLPKNIPLHLIEVTPAPRKKYPHPEQITQKEYEKINTLVKAGSVIIVLDERGQLLSSKMLAQQLHTWQQAQQHISLIIGGADGVNTALKDQAQHIWSLSPMTLPHALARVIMLEQLYRAYTILQNHPYHRQ